VFCGNGYGSYMAARAGHSLLAIDASPEAVSVANAHYQEPGLFFCQKEWPFALPRACFDFCFCLESVEHVVDGSALVAAVVDSLRPGGLLILSTPNENLMPLCLRSTSSTLATTHPRKPLL
jgi:2-polyprenyl-3-methyl-5-hydroxy-6-metoxy-1,4-benzoquinol methylase